MARPDLHFLTSYPPHRGHPEPRVIRGNSTRRFLRASSGFSSIRSLQVVAQIATPSFPLFVRRGRLVGGVSFDEVQVFALAFVRLGE